jgi:hypothetical protein
LINFFPKDFSRETSDGFELYEIELPMTIKNARKLDVLTMDGSDKGRVGLTSPQPWK